MKTIKPNLEEATLKDWLHWCEVQFVVYALRAAKGQQNKAADILGIHKSNIGRKLKELGIDANEFKE